MDTSTSLLTDQPSSGWDRDTELLGLNPVSLSGNWTLTSPPTPLWENRPEPRASRQPALRREPPTGTTDARISATTGLRGAWRPGRGGGSIWKAQRLPERWAPSTGSTSSETDYAVGSRIISLNPFQTKSITFTALFNTYFVINIALLSQNHFRVLDITLKKRLKH